MTKPIYIKLDEHDTFKEKMGEVTTLLKKIDSRFEELQKLRRKEQQFIETWHQRTGHIREKLQHANEILDLE